MLISSVVVGLLCNNQTRYDKADGRLEFSEWKRYKYVGTTVLIVVEHYKNWSRERGEYRRCVGALLIILRTTSAAITKWI